MIHSRGQNITGVYFRGRDIINAYRGDQKIWGKNISSNLLEITSGSNTNLLTTSRNLSASYIDINGLVQHAPIDTLRIDHRTGQPRILIEAQQTNYWRYSEQVNNPDTAASATRYTDVAIAPDGSMTADRIKVLGGEFIRQLVDPVTTTDIYTIEFFIKKAPTNSAQNIRITTNNSLAWNTGISHLIAVPVEWTKVVYTGILITSYTKAFIHIGGKKVDNSNDLTCDGETLIWGINVKKGQPSSYIKNEATTLVTRPADVVTVSPPEGTTQIITTVDDNDLVINTIPDTYQLPVGNISKIIFKQ